MYVDATSSQMNREEKKRNGMKNESNSTTTTKRNYIFIAQSEPGKFNETAFHLRLNKR